VLEKEDRRFSTAVSQGAELFIDLAATESEDVGKHAQEIFPQHAGTLFQQLQ
jgi:hypothetical protein